MKGADLGWLISLGWHQGDGKEGSFFSPLQYVTVKGACCYILPGSLIPYWPQLSLAVVARSCVNTAKPAGITSDEAVSSDVKIRANSVHTNRLHLHPHAQGQPA